MTSPANPFDAYHIAPISYDKDGHPIAEAPFTPTNNTRRYAVIVPPSKVIPIIFVPGIMGSNLKLKRLPAGFEDKWYPTPLGIVEGPCWPRAAASAARDADRNQNAGPRSAGSAALCHGELDCRPARRVMRR